MSEKAREMQGVDPKANVFANLYPVLYAAETPVSGGYEQQSMLTATVADQLSDGLRGRRVLDLGCGYGTTSMALARFGPARITAVDTSLAMIKLFQKVMLTDEDLESYLYELGAEEVLGDLFAVTLEHLKRRRAEFQNGIFKAQKFERLDVQCGSIIGMSQGGFHCVVGNNFLHWPVNQRKAVLKKALPDWSDREIVDQAIRDTLRPIATSLVNGGVGVFLEPKDFITFDTDPEREAYCEAHTMSSHPAFIKFNQTFNRLLKENYGIDRATPKTTGLFAISRIAGWAEAVGLKLLRVTHVEMVYNCDPIKAIYVRMPMWLGSQTNLSFDEKLKLGQRVMAEIDSVVTPEDRAVPVQQQQFVICFEKE